MLKSYEATLDHCQVKWLGEQKVHPKVLIDESLRHTQTPSPTGERVDDMDSSHALVL